MTFKLTIDLGNDAMRTGDDVARALRVVAGQIWQHGELTKASEARARIMDANGNPVGRWEVK